jgi:hypothetical protein
VKTLEAKPMFLVGDRESFKVVSRYLIPQKKRQITPA